MILSTDSLSRLAISSRNRSPAAYIAPTVTETETVSRARRVGRNISRTVAHAVSRINDVFRVVKYAVISGVVRGARFMTRIVRYSTTESISVLYLRTLLRAFTRSVGEAVTAIRQIGRHVFDSVASTLDFELLTHSLAFVSYHVHSAVSRMRFIYRSRTALVGHITSRLRVVQLSAFDFLQRSTVYALRARLHSASVAVLSFMSMLKTRAGVRLGRIRDVFQMRVKR